MKYPHKYEIGNRNVEIRHHSQSPSEILATHSRRQLLETIPSSQEKINSTSYDPAMKLDWAWYETLIALNENVTNSRKRARNQELDFDFTLEDLVKIWIKQAGLCALTGVELDNKAGSPSQKNPFRASVDRVDSDKGYTRDNIRLLCHWANNAKSTYDDRMFVAFCADTYNHSAQTIL